jgi:hypothetical protein
VYIPVITILKIQCTYQLVHDKKSPKIQ